MVPLIHLKRGIRIIQPLNVVGRNLFISVIQMTGAVITVNKLSFFGVEV